MTTTTYLPEGLPAPEANPIDETYWTGALDGRLMVQICGDCKTAQWPPEEICANCHSTTRDWVQASGRGTIDSWTRIAHPVHPALGDACPYIVVSVTPEEFPTVQMIGNLVGDPSQHVAMGLPVVADFERHDGYALVQWRLTDVGGRGQ